MLTVQERIEPWIQDEYQAILTCFSLPFLFIPTSSAHIHMRSSCSQTQLHHNKQVTKIPTEYLLTHSNKV